MKDKFISNSDREFQYKRMELWSNLVVAFTSCPASFSKDVTKWADDILTDFDERFKQQNNGECISNK